MKPSPRIAAPPDDFLVAAAERSLRFRYRAFLSFIGLLSACVVVSLAFSGSPVSRWAIAATGWVLGFGVPWLGWHLGVPFAGRIGAVIFQLTGLALGGTDPRDQLWALADLPVLFFLAGWGVDLCLRQKGRIGSLVGRLLFSLLWLHLCRETLSSGGGRPEVWFDLAGMVFGIVAVWLPRGALVPRGLRHDPAVDGIVGRGIVSAGAWIATRAGIAVLILLPSLIYLDLLDLPPRLRAEVPSSSEVQGAAAGMELPLFFWTREARGLTDADFETMEVHVADAGSTEALITAIRNLRRDPRSPGAVEAITELGKKRLTSRLDLAVQLEVAPVFYLDRASSGDDRVTSGFFTVPRGKWSRWGEIRLLTDAEISRQETRVRRSTFVVLAGSVLILLLLGGPSGGTATAWWIAIYLAGTHIGWVGESLDLVLERVRFTIWRDYANEAAGASLFGLHTLLLFLVRSTEWLTSHLVAQAGIWVALCWPVRPAPLLRSRLDRFWLQTGKILLVAGIFVALRFGFFLLGVTVSSVWTYLWFLLFPLLFVGAGVWWRTHRGAGRKLPNAGRAVAIAFVIRGWVALLTNLEGNAPLPEGLARAIGEVAVIFAIVAAVFLIVALERGTFLSPPHVEGQLWLIGVAAIPVLESIVSDPVTALIEDSHLFLGGTVSWLAFAAALWVIGPIFSAMGDFLSRWRAKGLDRIAAFEAELVAASRGGAERGVAAISLLFADLEIDRPQLWRHLGEGTFQRVEPAASGESHRLISPSLSRALGEVEESLRLEEMRLEWRWAAYHGELERWFAEGGDLLLVPISHEGELLGVFCAPDVPENRFLLRPSVATALAHSLADALLGSRPIPIPMDQAGRLGVEGTV